MDRRIVFLDYVRVIACFMVIVVHVAECYYCTAEGVVLASDSDRLWVSLIDGLFRPAVPLFVMVSSYLLLPLPYGTSVFAKKRFIRVFIPFAVWIALYAVIPPLTEAGSGTDGVWRNIGHILYNFTDSAGHLWFIYMLIGVYCVMPVISPWLKEVSKKGEMIFLSIWFLTTFHHFAKAFLGGIWGECLWNEFHALYYFSGFIGYVVLAHFIRYQIDWSLKKSLAVGIPCILVGYAVTASWFYSTSISSTDYYMVELSWRFCTPNVALMSFGMFVIMKHLSCSSPALYGPVRKISGLSYGIYLMHIFVLSFIFGLIAGHLSTPVSIFTVATATYFCCVAITWLLSRIPGHKYIIG